MTKTKAREIRAFMERTHTEANRLADEIDPKRRRRDVTGVLSCLDTIGSRAGFALHLPALAKPAPARRVAQAFKVRP